MKLLVIFETYMTFYEAALRVLEEAVTPLHAEEITKRAVDQGLLSHIGKTPEQTMLARLAGMAKRTVGRRLMVTAKDTFALTDWMLPEDAQALAETGLPPANPEEGLPPYRPEERHPEARAEYLRAIGRQNDRKRRDEDRRRRYPPVAEVAFQLLEECKGALTPGELLARARTAELIDDNLSVGGLLDQLAEDNQRRVDEGRRANFAAVRAEGGELQLSVEGQPVAEGAPSPVDQQKAFCQAANLKFDNGRYLSRVERQRQAPGPKPAEAASGEEESLAQTVRQAAKDARRASARTLRRKLGELDLGTFEKACVRLLHALHFRELKVARRGKDGPLLTARRRDGSLELRYAVRMLKGAQAVDRRQVQELKHDLAHHGSNIGLILSAGDVRGEARGEAVAGSNLVLLWCGEGLADKFFEGHVGTRVTTVELFEVDDAFFDQATRDAEDAQKRREERQRDRGADEREASPAAEASAQATEAGLEASKAAEGEADGDEGGDDGAEGAEEGSDGRRRRRRRRRPRRRSDGAPGAEAAAPQPTPEGAAAPIDASAEAAPGTSLDAGDEAQVAEAPVTEAQHEAVVTEVAAAVDEPAPVPTTPVTPDAG